MFRLEWRDVAISKLAEEWMKGDARSRADITAAADELERQLRRAPDIAGEGREPGTRILFVNPLTALFHVNVRTNTVLISDVKSGRRRR